MSRQLKSLVQNSSFPSFLMLVVLIIVNAILQPRSSLSRSSG